MRTPTIAAASSSSDQPMSTPMRPRAIRSRPRSLSFSPSVPRATSSEMMPCRMANAAIATPTGISTAMSAMPTAPAAISSWSPGAALATRCSATNEHQARRSAARAPRRRRTGAGDSPNVGRGLRRITWNDAPSSGPSVSGRSGMSPGFGGGVHPGGGGGGGPNAGGPVTAAAGRWVAGRWVAGRRAARTARRVVSAGDPEGDTHGAGSVIEVHASTLDYPCGVTARILVVDDDTALAEMIGIVLRTEGFEPHLLRGRLERARRLPFGRARPGAARPHAAGQGRHRGLRATSARSPACRSSCSPPRATPRMS